jgi:hypothetical protein
MVPSFKEKYAQLVGLSPVAPNCQQDDLTAAQIKASDSGIYLTDIDSLNLNLNEALDDCGYDSLWQILAAGRKNALQQMETDLMAAIGSINITRLQPFRGLIGETQSRGYATGLVEGQQINVAIGTRALPGAFVKVTKIGLLVSHNVDVAVSVSGKDTPFMVVCSADTPSYYTLPEPLYIPLDGTTTSFSYTIAGFRPKATQLACDCGGQMERIRQYLPGLVNTPAYGLLLVAEAGCSVWEAVYDTTDLDPVKLQVLAIALRYLALKFCIERIINSGIISRFTMMGIDELYQRRSEYNTKYEQRIGWLASDKGIDLSGSACYVCKPTKPSGMQKRGILS